MPLKKEPFVIIKQDLSKEIDVDDSAGRSVPINMNFVETGYLTKDTGSSLYGSNSDDIRHSYFNFKKKDGTEYFLSVSGKKIQKFVGSDWVDVSTALGTVTMTIATPAVITKVAHGLLANEIVYFTTTGALPTGIVAGTPYYVSATGLTTDTFQISATQGGSSINTTGSQSGVHTLNRGFLDEKEFGWEVYNNDLYGCNGYEPYFKFTGTVFTEYPSAPRGNILEIFEDKMFVSGVIAEPLTVYYSNTGDATTFSGSDLVQPLGTDSVTSLINYYGNLLIFKTDTIWKLTFIYDQLTSLYIPKLELQSGNYGACSRKAVTWVENDVLYR